MLTEFVVNIHAVDETVLRNRSIQLKERAMFVEVTIATRKDRAHAGKRILHAFLDTNVFEHVDEGMQARLHLAVLNIGQIVAIQRMPDFMTDQQVILIKRNVLPHRQQQRTRLEIKHRGIVCPVFHANVLTRHQTSKTAFLII